MTTRQPTSPFTVTPGSTVWVSTTDTEANSGLFGDVGPIASVAVFPADDAPHILTDVGGPTPGAQRPGDPYVLLRKPNLWERLPALQPGAWRLYTTALGAMVQVTVIGCPDG